MPPPAPPGFPLVAVVAPILVSVTIWAITGSAFALVFAILGPVVAIASVADSARQRRRARRREARRYAVALDGLAERIDDALATRRRAHEGARRDPGDPVSALEIASSWRRHESDLLLLLGRADGPSGIELDATPQDVEAEAEERLEELGRRAAILADGPFLVDAGGGVGLVGAAIPARALVRELLIQLCARLSPATTQVDVPAGEEWARSLPHPVALRDETDPSIDRAVVTSEERRILLCWAPTAELLPDAVDTVLLLPGAACGAVLRPAGSPYRNWRPAALSSAAAAEQARALALLSARHGMRPARPLPAAVAFATLPHRTLPPEEPRESLAAVIGLDPDPVEIDLVRDGPHAIVAGTTGSGKSELLITWILALARTHPPDRLAFLLVDFKGGAAFRPLEGLPHVAGLVSDLDGRRAQRAMAGLRAELRRREELLAAAAVRSIGELDPGRLPRLVVVVDEYAAVVTEHPELQEVFADLSARGRSLGIHLVLCTQRPSGVIRDAILANVTLRIALRLTDRGDSQAVLGSDAAVRLADEPPGRAVVVDGQTTRLVQLALADDADAARLRRFHGPARVTPQPWSDPLPEHVVRAELPDAGPGHCFGLVDLPAQQRHDPALYEPRQHGAMAVLGTARSGRSTALAVLLEAAGAAAESIPTEPAAAWSALERILSRIRDAEGPTLVVADDVDELLLTAGGAAGGIQERLELILRAGPAAGTGIALSARSATSMPQSLFRLIPSRLVLRSAGREDLLLAGVTGEDAPQDLPPGAGWWRGQPVQVALPARPAAELLAQAVVPTVVGEVGFDRPLAVVSTRPAADVARWRAGGAEVIDIGEQPAATPPDSSDASVVLIGDPDAWQSAWSLLAAVRRRLPLLIDGRVAPSELRALTRLRDEPPPLASVADEWWLVEDGTLTRTRLVASG